MGFEVGALGPVEINEPADDLRIYLRADPRPDRPVAVLSPLVIATGEGIPMVLARLSNSPFNLAVGVIHRLGCKMPRPETKIFALFQSFYRELIRQIIRPVHASDLLTHAELLRRSAYSSARKRAISAVLEEGGRLAGIDQVSTFKKTEGYPGNKVTRLIAFPEKLNAWLWPYAELADRALFSDNPFAVKHTDPRKWHNRLAEMFGDRPVIGTDYKSFEAHHRHPYSFVITEWLERAWSELPGGVRCARLVRRMMMGDHKLESPYMVAKFASRLRSGELWTSSGNWMLNYSLSSFMSAYTVLGTEDVPALVRYARENFVGLCEGDDGLMVDVGISQSLIDSLGLRLKYDRYKSYHEAAFCQIITDGTVCVRDPVKVMTKMNVLPVQLASGRRSARIAMMRLCAISHAYTCSNTPILSVYLRGVLNATRGIDVRRAVQYFSAYERERLHIVDAAMACGKHREIVTRFDWAVPASARVLVADAYGVSEGVQLIVEDQLRAAFACVDLRSNDQEISIELREEVVEVLKRYAEMYTTPLGQFWFAPINLHAPQIVERVVSRKPRANRAAVRVQRSLAQDPVYEDGFLSLD